MFHPFYVTEAEDEKASGMWVAASNLVGGDELLMEDGQRVYVKEVKIEKLAEKIKVYNLEVDEWHTYFVAGGVLVHNECHGNSKESKKEQHGYEIYEKETGDVVKTGISGQEMNKNGTSPRANSQVNKWNKEEGFEKYAARIVERYIKDRKNALEWEIDNALKLWLEENSMSKHKRPSPWNW